MKTIHLAAILFILFATSTAASVFAINGYAIGVPIIGKIGTAAIGAPPLNGGAPPIQGVLSFWYADQSPVFLADNTVTLQICTPTVCENVQATMTPVGSGRYSYSFPHPQSISGTVTIIVPAYALADQNGVQFPSVETVIGNYVYGNSPTTSQQPPTPPATNQTPLPLMAQQSAQLYNQAVSPLQPNQGSIVVQAGIASVVLILAAGGLLILPRKRT